MRKSIFLIPFHIFRSLLCLWIEVSWLERGGMLQLLRSAPSVGVYLHHFGSGCVIWSRRQMPARDKLPWLCNVIVGAFWYWLWIGWCYKSISDPRSKGWSTWQHRTWLWVKSWRQRVYEEVVCGRVVEGWGMFLFFLPLSGLSHNQDWRCCKHDDECQW